MSPAAPRGWQPRSSATTRATCRPTGTTATSARVLQSGIVHVGCWAHVRRAFKEAADALGKVSSRAGAALQALGFIAKLYRAESQLSKCRTENPERFVAARRAQVQPVLDTFRGWLQDKRDQVLPGSALGKAVAFALGEWPKLIRYLEHPQLTPDNNACEQAIRPFVVGRKNWLFSEARAEPTRARSCTA